MTTPPKTLLSVIVPVYKTERTIGRCLDSVLAGNKDVADCFEVVVVDDASPDGTRRILKDYQRSFSCLRCVEHVQNLGVAEARNSGLAAARGDYVMFVDSDDALEPSAISEIVDILVRYPVDLVKFQYQRLAPDGTPMLSARQRVSRYYDLATNDETVIKEAFSTFALSMMVANGVYKRELIGECRYDSRYRMSEDRVFGAQLYARVRSAYLSERIFYRYYQNEGSLSKQYTADVVRSLLDVQCVLLQLSAQLPCARTVLPLAVRKLMPTYLGWMFELVFGKNTPPAWLANRYFDGLETFMTTGSAFLPVVHRFCLGHCARRRSVLGLRMFRWPCVFRAGIVLRTRKLAHLLVRNEKNRHSDVP